MKNNASREWAHQQKRSPSKNGKIIFVCKYHNPLDVVKRFIKNFTILFLLYYGKAIKHESRKVTNA
jgi:hypothetical protein